MTSLPTNENAPPPLWIFSIVFVFFTLTETLFWLFFFQTKVKPTVTAGVAEGVGVADGVKTNLTLQELMTLGDPMGSLQDPKHSALSDLARIANQLEGHRAAVAAAAAAAAAAGPYPPRPSHCPNRSAFLIQLFDVPHQVRKESMYWVQVLGLLGFSSFYMA